MKKAVIFKLGDLDRFTVDPAAVLSENGIDSDVPLAESVNLAEAALKQGNPDLQSLFAEDADYLCCASRPRAVRALLDFACIDYRSKRITWLALDFDAAALKSAHGKPWYPVIDRDLCTGCGVCHDYCLFGSYIRDDSVEPAERVQVKNPLNCKTGCPACSRLCKSGALIFPFCPEPSLNGSLNDIADREASDLMKAFDADPMKVLEERRKKRRLIDEQKLADAERERFSRKQ